MRKSVEERIKEKFGMSLYEFQMKLSDDWADAIQHRQWKGIDDTKTLELIVRVRNVMQSENLTTEEFAEVHLIHPLLLDGFLNRRHLLDERLTSLLSMACDKYSHSKIEG